MRLVLLSFRSGLLVNLQYRSQLLFWTVVRLLYFALTFSLWSAIFAAHDGAVIRGYTLEEMVSYYLLIYIVSSLAETHFEWDMRAEIASGDMAPFLTKPQPFLLRTCMDGLAATWMYGLLSIVLYGGIAWALGTRLDALIVPSQIVVALLSILFALVITGCFSAMLGAVTFWVPQSEPILAMKGTILPLLSGATIPLDVLPLVAQRILALTPFPWMAFFPVRLLTKDLPVREIVEGLGMQLLWSLVLLFAVRVVWQRGLRRFEAVGT